MRLRTDSLAFRLVASAAVWSVLALVVGGFILSGIFRNSVEEAFDDQLNFYLGGLIAAAETDAPGHVTLEEGFADPRFDLVFSGWYWQIESDPPRAPEFSQRSRSLWDQVIAPTSLEPAKTGGLRWGYAQGPDAGDNASEPRRQPLRVLRQSLELTGTGANGKPEKRRFLFTVAGDLSETEADIASFNEILIWSFVGLGLALILAMVIQVQIGLQPLRRVRDALAAIREGRARSLEGKFPAEIAPLATELNSLIAHSAEVVERARTHVSNLAHFLKTPLTVLNNEAETSSGSLADLVKRQVSLMRRQVDHYLSRARAAGALDVLGNRTDVKGVANDLSRVLTRMHTEKKLQIEVKVPVGLTFRGEREDLEEMVGNLIENACKWAETRVVIEAAPLDDRRLVLTVADDGPGLPPDERARALERGERVDETVPGTGLGLSIVHEIARLYGGDISLMEAPLGGLLARLELPRTR